MGWQARAEAAELIPDIIDYFYKHATPNDVFVNALTGVGYIRESMYLDEAADVGSGSGVGAVHWTCRGATSSGWTFRC